MRCRFLFPVTGALLLCALALPLRAELPVQVARALKQQHIPEEAAAVFAQPVDAGAPVVLHGAGRPMNPASTMKLLTTYAALELLGPAFAWRTEAYAGGRRDGEVLHGDLILKGYGDPALTLERFYLLVHQLRLAGVREIRGDLVLDRSYFEDVAFDPGAFDGDPYRPYNAGPEGLLVNFKSTRFLFRPDGDKVLAIADPALPQLHLVNRLQLTDGACGDWKERLGYEVDQEAGGGIVVALQGSYARACGERQLDLSLPDHPRYVFELFRQLWQAQGGVLTGTMRIGPLPPEAALVTAIDSPPLADVIRQLNKYSNNLMARQLLITLGAEQGGPPGNPGKGADAIRMWLASRGMAFPELVIENGAGLSRVERITAQHLGEMLLAAYRSPYMPELMSSLPIYAVDGTLRRRASNGSYAGRAHLKSGSLDEVRAVAGYLLDGRGRRWVVVFMVNHRRAEYSKPAQEALLEWLYRYGD